VKRNPMFAALAALTLLVAAPMARAQAADPVAAFARPSTSVVVVLDLAQLDLDKLLAYGVDKAKANGVPQADIDKGLGEIKPQLDQAKGFINSFKDAGATKVYALLNAEGLMGGDFGSVVIPASSPENARKIADLITQMTQQGGGGAEGAPKVAIQGSNVVFASASGTAGQPAPNAKLTAALAAAAARPATLRVVVDGAFLAKASADQQNVTPEDKQLLQNTDTVSLAINVPPQSMFALSVTAKDAATAQKMAQKYAAELEKGKNDPEAKRILGADLDKMYQALAARTAGNTVTLSLDTKQIEEIFVPAIAKAAAAEQKKQQQGGGAAPEGLK